MATEKPDPLVVVVEGDGEKQLSLLIDDPSDQPKPAKKPASRRRSAGSDGDGASEHEGIDSLRKQLNAARGREDGERRAREAEAMARRNAEAEAARAKAEVTSTQHDAIVSALAAAKTEADTAQAALQAHLEAGEYDKASLAQRKLARAEATMMRYEEAKAEIDAAAKAKPAQIEQQPTASADPFEASIARLTPRSQSWLREHREYATDPKMNRKLLAAHHVAVAEDHIPDTDAYFAAIEQHLGLGEDDEEDEAVEVTTEKRQPRPSAPVTREANGGHNTVSGTRVTLSREEVSMAEALGMTREEYARNKIAVMKAGAYNRGQ